MAMVLGGTHDPNRTVISINSSNDSPETGHRATNTSTTTTQLGSKPDAPTTTTANVTNTTTSTATSKVYVGGNRDPAMFDGLSRRGETQSRQRQGNRPPETTSALHQRDARYFPAEVRAAGARVGMGEVGKDEEASPGAGFVNGDFVNNDDSGGGAPPRAEGGQSTSGRLGRSTVTGNEDRTRVTVAGENHFVSMDATVAYTTSSAGAATAASTTTSGGGVVTESDSSVQPARRPSRKTGVFVLPPHPGELEENGGTRTVDGSDAYKHSAGRELSASKQQQHDHLQQLQQQQQQQQRTTPVQIVITQADAVMAEVDDSGVDTEAGGTPSPLSNVFPPPPPYAPPSPSTSTRIAHAVIEEVDETRITGESNDDSDSGDDESEDEAEAGRERRSDETEYHNSRFLSQIHPVYEKKPGALKGSRKISQDSSGASNPLGSLPPAGPHHSSHGRHGSHLTGATRRISQHNRKVSLGSDSNTSSGHVVPSRKGSLVMIDQIPQIIHDSLQSYFMSPDLPSFMEEEQGEGQGFDRSRLSAGSRSPRVSIFSVHSRRSSAGSDVTFWDPQETLPHADHYRYYQPTAVSSPDVDGFRSRPTMYQLREEPESPTRSTVVIGDDLEDKKDAEEGEGQKAAPKANKTGWIQGVLVRCLLNIFGVMLFLRLTWITGQAGTGLASVIVLLSAVVTTLTTMSMAAICTNGEVRGGGAYYMISRSLGPEFGGAIGLIFSLANAVAAAMYVVGFSETLRDLVKDHGGVITGDTLHDVRVVGVGVTVLLLGVVMIGLDFETKAQLVLLAILVISIINFIVGTFISPSEDKRRAGFVGYQAEVLNDNFGPDFRKYDGTEYDFFKVFAIFFPAATGILAGANISGDLKDPSSDIPKGTFLAILLTTLVYLGIIWSTGSCMLRDALGTAATVATNVTMTLDDIQRCGNVTCEFGLHNSHGIMGIASGVQPLIYAGIFSATLSSALASLVSAPKVFQALGKDKLFPFIGYFAKDYGKNGEPRRGYFLTVIICLGMTCVGSLDIIAPIISNFFLMSYALINFSCFDAVFANSPGFRPSFKLYNKWCSLLGALVCVVIMFLISWWAALTTVLVVVALYIFVKYRKPDVNWGSSGQAHAYNDALKTTIRLVNVDEHVKNFRPQLLVLTGYPRNRPALVDFAGSITKRQSLLVCAHVFQGDMQRHLRHLRSTAAYRWFRNRAVKAFYTSVAAPTVRHGTQCLLQSQGLGNLRPNTLLMGFKNRWQFVDPRSVHNYVGIIHDAFDLRYGVGVLRIPGGLDTHKVSDILLDSTDDTLNDSDQDSIDEEESELDEEENAAAAARRKTSTIFYEKTDSPTSAFGEIVLQDFRRGIINTAYSHNHDDNDGDDDCDNDDTGGDDSEDKDTESSRTSKKNASDCKDAETTASKTSAETASDSKDATTTDSASADRVTAESEKTKKDGTGQRPEGSPPVLLRSVLSQAESLSDTINSNYFRNKQRGTIDVWWVFDDGGLGLLLPYILSTRKTWRQCKLRVFCAGTKRSNLDADHGRMAALLSKFRINYSDITVLPDLRLKPRRSSYKEFEELIYRWRLRDGETQEDYPWKVSDHDLVSHKQKIYMQIKIREKLLEHSMGASLVVVTLPVPRKFCPAGLYMAWLDTLTRDLPPTLLLRGNQQSVLTYFS